MMKAVLMSIQPKWCELIANGEKTIEVRKSKPNLETPFKVYIYCTNNKRQYLRKIETSCREIFITENKDIIGKTDKVKSLIGETTTFWESSGYNGKVIGEFVCDRIEYISPNYGYLDARCVDGIGYILDKCCLTGKELIEYGKGKPLYTWHISDLKIYDKPKELSEFRKPCPYTDGTYCIENKCEYYGDWTGVCRSWLERPPQSWCYVEELK